jgi:hypothetical protein
VVWVGELSILYTGTTSAKSHIGRCGVPYANGRLAAITLLLGSVIIAPTSLRAGSKEDQQLLDSANRRWKGAHCRSLQQIEVKKDKDRDGWSKSKWLFWSPERGNSRVMVLVSDSAAIRQRFHNGIIPLSTEFISRGWFVEEPSGNLYLELELAEQPVKARVYYYDDWVGRVSVKRIDDFERWARFDFMEIVAAADEQLVAPGKSEPLPEAPARPTQLQPTAPFSVQVLAVSTEPTRVLPGEELGMVVVFSVEGIHPGAATTITERRVITYDQLEIASFEASIAREAGIHTSSQPVRLPPTAAPGVYELKVAVSANGVAASGSTIFEVRDNATTPNHR